MSCAATAGCLTIEFLSIFLQILAAKALDNLYCHQPAAVCGELGVAVVLGGTGGGGARQEGGAREAVRGVLRGALAKAGAMLEGMPW